VSGLSLLLGYFTDANAPALQGKLKLFVFGLALGHPVNMPSTSAPSSSNAAITAEGEAESEPAGGALPGRGIVNVLNSVSTGGRARVYASQALKRAELQVHPERQQDVDAFLRSEGDEFRDHVTLSYRQEPWSGTWWSKNNFSSSGSLVIDLGREVRDIDTLAIFQMATNEAKATSMIMQRGPGRNSQKSEP
jgi:hypothetical protein